MCVHDPQGNDFKNYYAQCDGPLGAQGVKWLKFGQHKESTFPKLLDKIR